MTRAAASSIALALLFGLALGACGKKGDPVAPSASAARAADQAAEDDSEKNQNE